MSTRVLTALASQSWKRTDYAPDNIEATLFTVCWTTLSCPKRYCMFCICIPVKRISTSVHGRRVLIFCHLRQLRWCNMEKDSFVWQLSCTYFFLQVWAGPCEAMLPSAWLSCRLSRVLVYKGCKEDARLVVSIPTHSLKWVLCHAEADDGVLFVCQTGGIMLVVP